ncbi:MAG: hypothetical protein AB7T06_22970 [Kofleriaceae bacterium]
MRLAVVAVCVVGCGNNGDDVPVDARCEPAVLYLNRTGTTYNVGRVDDSSMNLTPIVDGERVLPPWPYDDIDWASLTGCIRAGLAPFPVTVTETDPGMAKHTEIVFTTSYWAGPAGTTMITTAGCLDTYEVIFLFGNALPTYARACHLAVRTYAQITAQLDLVGDCEDWMNNQQDCSETRVFKDADSACVDDADVPTDCRCGGATQNSYRSLLAATACP